jgi:hypothetical protein
MTIAKDLYRFIEGDSAFIYTVTSADDPEDYDAGDGVETYESVAIGRDDVQSKAELSKDKLTVSLAIDNPVGFKWFTSSLDFPLTLTIFSKEGDDVEVEWKGRLANVSPNKKTFDFGFESIFTSLRRPGLRQRYQITCPALLYGQGCNLDKEDFAHSGAITAVADNVVTFPAAAGFADGYFTGGIFEDNAGNLRFITNQTGATLTLIRSMTPLIDYIDANGYSGLTGRIFPGCDRAVTTCNSKFGNLLNNRSFPFIPQLNPFNGSIV